ncbi:MAG: Flp pilus assembly complex ATPase component TadA [Clostridia bacterium]|nr:Flp pilus assembly complex ATPase component TadA [Clostridia bacterium]
MKVKKAPASFDTPEEMKSFVLGCEADFETDFRSAVDEMLSSGVPRIIALSGPTCSGKTTAANKIISEIEKRGRRINAVSIDDFYYDKDVLHRMSLDSGSGEIDYDSHKTIDLDTLGAFVDRIFDGGELSCPVFDFHSGRRISYRKILCGENDIFIFEGIQALYPQVTALLGKHGFSGAYIAPACAVASGASEFSPNKLRFLRRLVRDRNFRSTPAEFTFKIWQSVRKNEEENIFPFADSAHIRIDSSFAYELGVLKPYLTRILGELPDNSVYRADADDILEKLSPVEAIPAELLPEKSLYREFV